MIFMEIGNNDYNCPFCNEEIEGEKNPVIKYQRWGREKKCPECGKIYGESEDYKGNVVGFK